MRLPVVFSALAFLTFACGEQSSREPMNTTATDSTHQAMKPSETGYADVNGLKLYYERYGQGKPLVLLHGGYMTIPLNWTHFIPLLAKGRHVIAAEMQGHGRTRDIDREITYEGMADDVSGLLKHLKIDQADIVGYSTGGGIAFQMAVRHPDQVRRLVVLSGTYKHDGWWPDAEAGFHEFKPELFRGTPIESEYIRWGNDTAHFSEFLRKGISPDLQPYDWSKEVMQIKAPLFYAIGDADGVRYEHALDLFRAKGGGKMGDMHGLPESRLAILPGTSHIGMMKRPEWLVPMITDFLDSDLDPAPPSF